MNIIITGGTGLIGRHLASEMLARGHEVTILTRQPERSSPRLPEGVHVRKWDGRTPDGWLDIVDGADVIVNLAGESLAAGRWTEERQKRILVSRVLAGQAVSEAVRLAAQKPGLVIQASAIGIYGNLLETPATEETSPADDFLAQVCVAWEKSTQEVEQFGIRRVVIRTGVILSKEGGPLPRMLLPMRLFFGGPLGNGRQWLSWIHLQDEIDAIRFLIDHPTANGPYNLSAPQALRNRDFMKTLGRVIRRPAVIPAPAFAIRLLFGEMATLVLDGQHVIPEKLQRDGFEFRFQNAESALRGLLV